MPADSFIEKCHKQFTDDCEVERKIREEALVDLRFVAGEGQWHDGIRRERQNDGRPCLTFSKLHIYIQAIANEARQNKPQPKVNPIGSGATTDTANVQNGIIRHIQYRSQADVASDTALDYSAGGGFGFISFTTEYADPKSFDQEVKIETVQDPFSIYGVLIPACRGEEPDHAFQVTTLTKEQYKSEYGNREQVDFDADEWKTAGDWIDGKNVRTARYWWRKKVKKTLRLVQDEQGQTAPIYSDNPHYDTPLPFVMDGTEPMEREVDTYEVRNCIIDGRGKIPGTETVWVADTIPIVAVLGRQMIVDGQIMLFSLVRHVREAQQLINIYKTAIAEKIALGNRVPYIGPKGSFKDPRWQDANKKNYAYLEYELVPTPNGAGYAAAPSRQQLEEQIQALSFAVQQEIDDLKSGMGIFDASLGKQGNETSGIGIARRQQQANVTNFHFSDNLNRAQWELCRKLLKVIPIIYDRPGRQVRIVGEDQQHSVVVVNQPHIDPDTGQPRHYPLNVGDYDVVVTVGPSYTTARLEGADTLSQFFQAAPSAVPILGDLWVGSLDYPWAREGARRLKAAAPQEIVNEPQEQGAKIPPQVEQYMTQLQQQLQKTQAFAQSLHEQLQTKQPEIESRERIEMAKLQFDREKLVEDTRIQMAKIGSTEDIVRLENELEMIKHRVGLQAAAEGAEAERQHKTGMQQAQQDHAAQMSADDQIFQEKQAEKEPANGAA